MRVLHAEHLSKVYGEDKNTFATKALDGVDITVNEGEFIAIMGPSGSGKSTLINILSGIISPTAGMVEIDGKQIQTMDQEEMALFRRRKLGFVFQEFNLLDNLTLKENIMLPMVLDKKDQRQMEEKTEYVMELFGISEIADKYPVSISGGQQQRVAVCRALVNNPKIIFADEPTGNLDSKSANTVMHCFETINEKEQVTILMVTHDIFAASFCKKVIFIKDGKIHMEIVKKGTHKEFFEQILDCQAIMGGEIGEI